MRQREGQGQTDTEKKRERERETSEEECESGLARGFVRHFVSRQQQRRRATHRVSVCVYIYTREEPDRHEAANAPQTFLMTTRALFHTTLDVRTLDTRTLDFPCLCWYIFADEPSFVHGFWLLKKRQVASSMCKSRMGADYYAAFLGH